MSPKNAAAVSLGRKGGQARAKNLTPEQRSEASRKAVEARWAKTQKSLDELVEKNERWLKAHKKKKTKTKAKDKDALGRDG